MTHLDKYLDAVQGQDTLVRNAKSKGRNILGLHRPRDALSKEGTSETFLEGTHCSGTHRHGMTLAVLGGWSDS
jgi:hypothetical protein